MSVVYICTRDRVSNLEKVLPRWLDQDFHVVLVVEKEEFVMHRMMRERLAQQERSHSATLSQIEILRLPEKNKGIGYSRAYAVWHAHQQRLKSIIMSDDDIRPAPDSDMRMLVEEARKSNTLGVGAVLRIHDHFTGGAISANSGVILCPGGWGGRLYGLNVRLTMDLGNYEERLDCLGEDDELKRQGIADGYPWAVHCDVWGESIGSRYQPGGVQALAGTDRPARELQNHWFLYKRWPEYVSCPPKKFRMAWQRMLDYYIPDWRERSAIHGGVW